MRNKCVNKRGDINRRVREFMRNSLGQTHATTRSLSLGGVPPGRRMAERGGIHSRKPANTGRKGRSPGEHFSPGPCVNKSSVTSHAK